LYLPGIIKRYGADQPCNIVVQTTKAPTSTFNVGQIGMTITADISVYVNKELATVIEIIDAAGLISVDLTNFLLKI